MSMEPRASGGLLDRAAEAAAVREVCEDLGIPGIVDVHVHFMPENVMAKVWDYFDRQGPLVAREWPIAYKVPIETRVAILEELSVLRYSGLAYPHRPEMAKWLNDWTMEFARTHTRCAPSATFYPEEGAPAYVEEALEGGAKIFKAHVQVGAYDPRDVRLDDVWRILERAKVPVVIHCGSAPVAGSHTGVEPIEEVLRRYPELTLVIAHMGNDEYEGFVDLAERYSRVHLDTTMVFTPFNEAMSPYPRDLLPRLGALEDRVVFGSDFPNIPYNFVEQVKGIAGLDLPRSWKQRVCYHNPLALIGPIAPE